MAWITTTWTRMVALLLLAVFTTHLPAGAGTTTNNQTASAADVANAIRNSPNANAWMRNNADAIGSLAMFESGGQISAFNGSCCYGVLQMNTENIDRYAKTDPQTYRNLSLQDQVNAWSKLTSDMLGTTPPQMLIAMGTFDGRPVDGSLVLSCVQLGVGNCQTMIRAGNCGGFRDRNGTSICDMADRVNGGTYAGGGTGSGSGGATGSSPPRYTPIDCVRDPSGSCMGMSAAMEAGFENGSGVSMARLRSLIQMLLVVIALFVMGSAITGTWKHYARGGIAVADFTYYMKRALLVVLTVVVIMTVL